MELAPENGQHHGLYTVFGIESFIFTAVPFRIYQCSVAAAAPTYNMPDPKGQISPRFNLKLFALRTGLRNVSKSEFITTRTKSGNQSSNPKHQYSILRNPGKVITAAVSSSADG